MPTCSQRVVRSEEGETRESEIEAGADGEEPIETYVYDPESETVHRTVRTRWNGPITTSQAVTQSTHVTEEDPDSVFDSAWLRRSTPPEVSDPYRSVRVVDLFSGCGGMTLGIAEAARALNYEIDPLLAVDTDRTALSVFSENFNGAEITSRAVEEIFGLTPGAPVGDDLESLVDELGRVDILVGGPPCQGHSNLNNHSRRDDRRNELFLSMARAAEVLQPSHILIENVRDIVHDRENVFERTVRVLEEELGYLVDTGTLEAEKLGVPQQRHRTFIVASTDRQPDLDWLKQQYQRCERSFDWACRDLEGTVGPKGFDTTTRPTGKTLERINWLHDGENRWELKNELRPPCHRDKKHSYLSVYGRMKPEEPAPTITTGFTCMGQGRFVHPHERRTITPHEAARLQFFPDYFQFRELDRGSYKRLIGNAVPPKLTYVLALELLR